MFIEILLLIVGMALLIKGADLFVEGSSKIAKALKIPSLIIGLTLVSMGTSAPEASVSINASINNLKDFRCKHHSRSCSNQECKRLRRWL